MKIDADGLSQFVTYKPDGWGKTDTLSAADGVLFRCPASGCSHAVLCWFRGRVPDSVSPGPGRWEPSGTGLADLTLSPSVHLTGPGCGWHGWVKNGDAS